MPSVEALSPLCRWVPSAVRASTRPHLCGRRRAARGGRGQTPIDRRAWWAGRGRGGAGRGGGRGGGRGRGSGHAPRVTRMRPTRAFARGSSTYPARTRRPLPRPSRAAAAAAAAKTDANALPNVQLGHLRANNTDAGLKLHLHMQQLNGTYHQ